MRGAGRCPQCPLLALKWLCFVFWALPFLGWFHAAVTHPIQSLAFPKGYWALSPTLVPRAAVASAGGALTRLPETSKTCCNLGEGDRKQVSGTLPPTYPSGSPQDSSSSEDRAGMQAGGLESLTWRHRFQCGQGMEVNSGSVMPLV